MLGLCCEWLSPAGENLLVSRSLQLGRFTKGHYSPELIRMTYAANLQNLLEFLPVIRKSGIRFFRVSSSLFPLFDKVDPEIYKHETLRDLLARIGKFVLTNEMRVNTHPGQFVVLSSDSQAVVKAAVTELDFHAWVFDQMGLPPSPYYGINVHGGKGGRTEQLRSGIARLSEAARLRLTLENDEFSYTVSDLALVDVPVVFDCHHHSFNSGGLSQKEGLELAISTWGRAKPTTHLANTPPGLQEDAPVTKRRVHSDYLTSVPEALREAHEAGRADIEVEAKAKNLAIFRAVKELGLTL